MKPVARHRRTPLQKRPGKYKGACCNRSHCKNFSLVHRVKNRSEAGIYALPETVKQHNGGAHVYHQKVKSTYKYQRPFGHMKATSSLHELHG